MARKTKQGFSMNLGEVESYFRPQAGPYQCEIIGVEEGQNDSLAWDFKITEGRYKGREFRGYTGTRAPNKKTGDRGTAWQTRELVDATSVKIDGESTQEMDFFEGMIGEAIGVRVAYREWEGKEKLDLSYFIAGDEDDEKPPKKGKRARDEDDEEEERPARSSKRKRDEEEDEEPARGKKRSRDDDEDEEEEPKKGKKGKKAKADLTQEEIRDMDTDELETLIEKHELDVDLSKFKVLKKQQSAVIDAAEEAGLLSD